MTSHERLFGEFVVLLRGLKEINAEAIESTRERIEVAGSAVLSRLDLLGPSRLTDLAAALGLDPSSVSRQVAAVERSGWVTREPDPSDGRASRLLLTPAGQDLVRRLRAARADILARMTPGWTDAELEGLTEVLARLNTDLERARTSTPATTSMERP